MTSIERQPDLSDFDLLGALLDAADRLSDREARAFDSMAQQIKSRNLTRSQRQWAESVYDRLELEANRTLNLVSTGQVPTGHVPQFVWELNKPLKPPGR